MSIAEEASRERAVGSSVEFAATYGSSQLGANRYRRAKRIFDIVIACIALVVFSPLYLFVALGVLLTDGAPIIFRHKRVGFGGKTFDCLKFRSMRKDADKYLERHPELLAKFRESFKLENDPRVTRIGKFIRATSLDELPQFVNVLRGEMSIVGPRPIVVAELEKYGDFSDLYLSLIPGCTGLWQCSGRSETSYEERVQLDAEYARKASLRFDVVIVIRTFGAVLRRHGAK